METIRTVWGIRDGAEHFDASGLFKSGHICIGWPYTGDLRNVPKDRKAIKKCLVDAHRQCNPTKPPTKHQMEQGAGTLYRFMYEMQDGDIVVYVDTRDKRNSNGYVGIVDGPYKYDPKMFSDAPHMRKVKWKRTFSPESVRTQLTVRGQILWRYEDTEEFRALMQD